MSRSKQTPASPIAEFSDPIAVVLDVVTGAMANYCRSHSDTVDACQDWESGRDDEGHTANLEFTVQHYSVGAIMEAWNELFELDLMGSDDQQGQDFGDLADVLGAVG